MVRGYTSRERTTYLPSTIDSDDDEKYRKRRIQDEEQRNFAMVSVGAISLIGGLILLCMFCIFQSQLQQDQYKHASQHTYYAETSHTQDGQQVPLHQQRPADDDARLSAHLYASEYQTMNEVNRRKRHDHHNQSHASHRPSTLRNKRGERAAKRHITHFVQDDAAQPQHSNDPTKERIQQLQEQFEQDHPEEFDEELVAAAEVGVDSVLEKEKVLQRMEEKLKKEVGGGGG
uniref:Uncharacterized protein n=1 Tax=Craspedostauros australis TaxID=1486917 RepID=A0A7R9ZQX3_9STRA|mmetsp:Transcript_6331/g.17229  ORF Transcript_6331/g.17229 Transcript_6331/m.17229 type:complete len:231 (+) Transcript_6331:379-1071(+)